MQLIIRTNLLDESINKNTPESLLKTGALETIDFYSQVPIHAYTDGSAKNATTDAGYGAVIQYKPTKRQQKLFGPCGTFRSNYDAEITAIEKTLERIATDFEANKTKPEDIVIFTDSQSFLQASLHLVK